jgi:hypothetical protein
VSRAVEGSVRFGWRLLVDGSQAERPRHWNAGAGAAYDDDRMPTTRRKEHGV